MKTSSSVICFVVGILILTGCVSAPVLKDAETISVDDRVIFGSVEVFVDNEKQTWGVKWDRHSNFYLIILPENSSEAHTYHLAKDGNFYWVLPDGKYTLLGYQWQDGGQSRMGEFRAEFTAGESGEAKYLGAIEIRGNKQVLMPEILDKYDLAKPLFNEKFAGRENEPHKSLIALPEPVGNFSVITSACHTSWKIGCTDNYRGVTPLQPEVANYGFPVSQTSTPTFRWEPSTDKEVGYDFALYEAATFNLGGATPSYTAGHLVAYEEELKSDSWTSPTPLKSETKYYWSVRLRKGATVSSWSTLSYSYYVILAAGWGSGQWFAFQTPQ
jgi:hypothetical protein